MYQGKHCFFYAPGADGLATFAAHYDRDLGDGTHRLFATLDDGTWAPVDGPQCDPAKPEAGHWSEVPA